MLAVLVRGSSWFTSHLGVLRNPILIPVVVTVASIAGFTPSSMEYAVQWSLRCAGSHGMADTLYVSQEVVTNVWFWILLAGFMLWQFMSYIYTETTFFQRRTTPVAIPPIEPPDDGPLTRKKRLSDVPSKDSGEEDSWATTPELSTCFAGWLLLEGQAGRLLDKPGARIRPRSSSRSMVRTRSPISPAGKPVAIL